MLQAAPVLLGLAVLIRMLWGVLLPNGLNVVDLHVYVDGSAALVHGHLYDYTYSDKTPDFPLPFTYPPFAALVFFPLHFLPFPLVAVSWQLATIAALYWVIRIAQGLMGLSDQNQIRVAMLWTALGMWSEPMRSTLDYGQVNVFLMLAAALAVRSTRWWWSGLLVGVSAGIKLTPAVFGLYFAARKRWGTAIWSAIVFGATVGLSFLLVGAEATTYFGTYFGDASRIGPVGSVWNQSLRGALSRLAGYDVGSGAWWIVGMLVLICLAVLAWRALPNTDKFGQLLVVALFGLMASPISWSHHWVWLVPMLVWLVYGPMRGRPGMRIVAGFWLIDIMVGIPWVLSFFQSSMWPIPRPWPLAWGGAVDAIGVLATYAWLAFGRDRADAGEVAAAAIIADGKLLLAKRTRPPELAGMWELPGGKVEVGETPQAALSRELAEELGIVAEVGPRIGTDVTLPDGRWVLRAYRATIAAGTPAALDHSDIRWVDAGELDNLDIVPNDRAWLDDLRELL